MPIYVGPGRPTFGKYTAHLTGGNQGGGFYVAVMNAEAVNAIVASVGKRMKTETNSQIRSASKQIAKDIVVPALNDAKQSAQPRIAKHMEVRPKIDRLVAVQIGSVNPKGLKGFKPGQKNSRRDRAVLAWGSEFGPKGGRRNRSLGGGVQGPLREINHYGVPRRESGYWVQPTINRVIPQVVERYNAAIYEIWQWAIGVKGHTRSRFAKAA